MISFGTEHMIGTNVFNIACKKLKIAQIAQVNQLFLPIEFMFAYTGGSARKGYLFFRLQVYERVGISPIDVYERVAKSVISA